MQYLITGGSGFVGRHLAKLLLDAGHGVTYTGRQQSRNMDTRISFFPWDGQSEPPVDAMARLDGIFHLLGEPVAQRWNEEVKQRIRDSRIKSTRLLVDAIGALRHKPPVLVSASAIGYYGERGDERLTETAAPGTGFLANVCKEGEAAACTAEAFGLRVVRVRIAIVLGPGGGALMPMLPLFRLGLGGKLGSGQQWMSWIHVHDLARLLFFAANTPAVAGALNGGSPTPVTNTAFTKELAAALHRPAFLPAPRFALQLAMGDMASMVLSSARVIPSAAEQQGFQFLYPTLRPCLEAIVNGHEAHANMSASTVS